jgi:hypothetical protein
MAIEEDRRSQESGVDPVALLKDIERKLEELAIGMQLWRKDRRKIEEEHVKMINEAAEMTKKLYQTDHLALMNVREGNEGLHELINDLNWAFGTIYASIAKAGWVAEQYCAGREPSDTHCVLAMEVSGIKSIMGEVMSAVEGLTGQKCGVAIRNPKMRERYDLPSFLYDISSCVHTVAEWLNETGLLSPLERRGERCYLTRDANEYLADLCVSWDNKANEKAHLYYEGDRRSQVGLVSRDGTTFRLSPFSTGVARVYRDGIVTIDGYSKSALVTAKYLMERLGYSCTATEEGRDSRISYIPPSPGESEIGLARYLLERLGYRLPDVAPEAKFRIRCTPPSPDVLESPETRSRLADVLSWMTSADVRIGRLHRSGCEDYCRSRSKEVGELDLEKCINECLSKAYDEEDRLWETVMGGKAGVEPGHVAMRDLEEFGIRWHREIGQG